MKKILLLIFVFTLAISFPARSQVSYGIKGGINFTSFSSFEIGNISEAVNKYTGFNAGVAVNFRLPYGFAIQPELIYVSKGARFTGVTKVHLLTDYIELPVNIQYGLDLIMMRPFIALTPYIGYAVRKDLTLQGYESNAFGWNQFNRFEYGIGIGGGIEMWRFQITARYNWNIGDLTNIKTEGTILDTVTSDIIKTINRGNFRGLEVSLAFFF